MDYDDETALTDYIWDYYGNLMTEFEQQMSWAEHSRRKRAAGHADVADVMLRRHGISDNPAAEAILAQGLDAFRRRVAHRLLQEHRDQIFVNRCPACGRIARAPAAQQCFQCGHDWHRGKT